MLENIRGEVKNEIKNFKGDLKMTPDDFLGDSDADSLNEEEKELQKELISVLKKLKGSSWESITNEDLLKYLRVVNYNFSALRRFINVLSFRQGLVENSISDLSKTQTKILDQLTAFLDTHTLLEDSLSDDDEDSSND